MPRKYEPHCAVPEACFHCPYPDCVSGRNGPTKGETQYMKCAELEKTRATRPSVACHVLTGTILKGVIPCKGYC